MHERELRKEIRISVNDLPKEYSSFTILLPHGIESTVYTSDASLSGFGFYSKLGPDEFIVGLRLVLYPLGQAHPVYGDIVHTMASDKGTRIGVRLLGIGGFAVYQKAIKSIIDQNNPI